MDNNSEIPDGWVMSDEMAKKVSEALDRKSFIPEDELQDALEDMARDIALIEPNPEDWAGCDIISNILPPIADKKLTQTINHHFECICQ
jgi:hypothetical protein